MIELYRGRYVAREARGPRDVAAAQDLRARAFGLPWGRADRDGFDAECRHILVAERESGAILACFRTLRLETGAALGRSYSAQYYDLGGLAGFEGPILEIGRFCVHPRCDDPDVLRLAWAALTAVVDRSGARLLCGCASFAGTETARHSDALALLRDRHLAPGRWRPRIKAPAILAFDRGPRRTPDLRKALAGMPPLLRSYLALGGWVSDHAVIDAAMNTLHVFTGLEVAAIPPARKRLLRAAAGEGVASRSRRCAPA